MIYLGTSLVYKYLDSLNINDLPRQFISIQVPRQFE